MESETQITILDEAPQWLSIASSIEVTDTKSEKEAAEVYSKVDTVIKDIETKRVSKVKPFNDIVKEINQSAKDLAKPFIEAKEILKKSMSFWRSQEDIRLVEEQRNSLEHNAAREANYGDMNKAIELHQEAQEIAKTVAKTVKTEDGNIRYRTDMLIDEIDIDALPDTYIIKTANEKLIKADIKAGGSVRGVKWHEERIPINYKHVIYPL